MRQLSPVDAAWLALESRDTPMHVGGLLEFTLPPGAPDDYLSAEFDRMRAARVLAPPWNLELVSAPFVGNRLPLMRESEDVDLDYHIRHSALPHPGGQRELGVLVSRLHSNPLDLHRPLWEVHMIEGLEGNRYALYCKMHHSLVDGVSGMRLLMRAMSTDPHETGLRPFWTIGEGTRPRAARGDGREGPVEAVAAAAREGAATFVGLARATLELARASVEETPLQVPYRVPASPLGGWLAGQRRFATQQYELERLKRIAHAAGCTLNDVVLQLSGSALRRYLLEKGELPERSLTAGIPVNLRDEGDESMGTAIGMTIADLGTNVADPADRLRAVARSMAEAKRHLAELPPGARTPYALLLNAPYIASLLAGLGGIAPVPFNVAVSNVPGPPRPLYMNGSRLDALYPISLLMHGSALNISCVSYAGTLNFGFTGARDNLPHLQRIAVNMGRALDDLDAAISPQAPPRAGARAKRPAAEPGGSGKARRARADVKQAARSGAGRPGAKARARAKSTRPAAQPAKAPRARAAGAKPAASRTPAAGKASGAAKASGEKTTRSKPAGPAGAQRAVRASTAKGPTAASKAPAAAAKAPPDGGTAEPGAR